MDREAAAALARQASALSAAHADHYICGLPGGLRPGQDSRSAGAVVRMSFRTAIVPLVAQAAAERPEAPALLQYLPLLVIAAAAYLLLFRPEQERRRRQQDLLAGLKKNDRVLTTAGIYGTVANVERDAGRVVLKVDDAANVKITVTLASIASVLGDEKPEARTGSNES